MRTTLIRSFVLAVIAAAAASCSGTATLPSSVVSTLSISGNPPAVGSTSQFSAIAVLASAPAQTDVTRASTWQSDTTTVATVSSTGVVTGVAAGSATLTATYQGTAVSEKITIP